MASFLELVKDAYAVTGTGDPEEITDVADVDGYAADVKRFIQQAWEEVQLAREDWLWMQREAMFATVSSTGVYAWSDMLEEAGGSRSIPPDTGFRSWLTHRRWYVGDDGQHLRKINYEVWRRYNKVETAQGKPQVYAIGTDDKLYFRPVPDDAYEIEVVFQTGVQPLENNADIPNMPSAYHQLLKWRAVMLAHGFDTDAESTQYAAVQYANYNDNLLRSQSPGWITGGTLA